MRRLGLIGLLTLAAAAAGLAAAASADDSRTYEIEMLNAFGIVSGSEVRIAGVATGTVEELEITPQKRALAMVELSGPLATLGEDTTCSSEPQSLIAEYYIDCQPRGEPLPDGARIPAEQVRTTVQADLVLNTLRRPYAERLRLIVNELGTAIAGNSENLNAAIRLAAPAFGDLRGVTRILARQRRALARLNADAERVVSRLAERRRSVSGTIVEARDTAGVAAERRADLARGADRIDDFTAELRPTLRELGETARSGLPLLRRLEQAAPSLNSIAARLPAFSAATEGATASLGRAAGPGRAALRRGRDEVATLRRAGRKAPVTAEILADLLRDLDDPRRRVETDARASRRCVDASRPCWSTGRRAPTGYTGLEGLLNYVYYQTGALNQFDSIGHMLQFNAYDVEGPCSTFNAGTDVPAADGGRTKEILEAHPCVSWLGPNQPDITFDQGLPRYDNSVCPQGSTDLELCDPAISTDGRLRSRTAGSAAGGQRQPGGPDADGGGEGPRPGAPSEPALPGLPDLPPVPGLPPLELPPLDDQLDVPLDGLGGLLGRRDRGAARQINDLLEFLLSP